MWSEVWVHSQSSYHRPDTSLQAYTKILEQRSVIPRITYLK